jgi:hypothetical protein
MNKLISFSAAIMAAGMLYGCATVTGWYYKGINYGTAQAARQAQKADAEQVIKAIKPIENPAAKSAVIIVPNLKVCRFLIKNPYPSWDPIMDDLSKTNLISFDAQADQIVKRSIFETTKKAGGENESSFEKESYDYRIYLGSKNRADQPPKVDDWEWWIEHKSGKFQTRIEPITSNNDLERALSFLQQIEDFVLKTEAKVKGVKRFDTARLKQGMAESELKSYYGAIKETILSDPFTPNVQYNVILFEALPPLDSNKVNVDIASTYWGMFYDHKAITFGIGKEKEAEHSIYSALVNQSHAAGKIKQSRAERMIYDKFVQLYGTPDPITKEISMFRILLAEKIENGKISNTEADYLMAQKEAEVAERIKESQRREEQMAKEDAARRELITIQQSQLANQQQATEVARRSASTQAFLGIANYINQQTYQQQMLQSLNRPFSMSCWVNGQYVQCQQR